MKKYLFILLNITALSFSQNKDQKNQNCVLDKASNKTKITTKIMDNVEKNVLDTNLEIAGTTPLTGFYRNGFCSSKNDDNGIHVVAAVMTDEFLNFSKEHGNDLITPNLQYGFPGLKKGDVWCLCAKRWKEAFSASVAPPVILNATNKKALQYIALKDLVANEKK